MRFFSKRMLRGSVIFSMIMILVSCQTMSNVSKEEEFNDIVVICNDESTVFSGENIASAKIINDPMLRGRYSIEIILDDYAKKSLAVLTNKYVGMNMSFFVRETKVTTARVMEPILDGRVWISGYDSDEAERMLDLFIRRDS